ncbi:MAG: DeoR family transcriptional regulator, partial [Deltaproteobacteria bacterium]
LNSLQDPLGDLMDGLKRESQECLTSILENGWLGYLYQYCQIDPCQKTILLGLDGKSLTLFESGEVFHVSRGASNLVTKFFMCLASGEKTKEQIVKEVWEQNYHPLRHDPLIYSLVSKLRKELGNNASWIEATELGYQLQKGVSVKEFSPKQSSLSVPSTPQGLPVQSGIQPGITYRQQQLLALTAKLKSIDVKTCVAHFKISTATANRDLAFLETHGMLFRTGKGRSTQYHVVPLKEEVT